MEDDGELLLRTRDDGSVKAEEQAAERSYGCGLDQVAIQDDSPEGWRRLTLRR